MGSRFTLAAGALIATLMTASLTINAGAPQQAEEVMAWRPDLAAATSEARRTKRPLLAVFR